MHGTIGKGYMEMRGACLWYPMQDYMVYEVYITVRGREPFMDER